MARADSSLELIFCTIRSGAFAAQVQTLVTEEYVPALHRHTLIARLLSPGAGSPMEDILALYDVRLLHWTSDLITLGGFERTEDEKGLRALDCAQTWVLQPARDD